MKVRVFVIQAGKKKQGIFQQEVGGNARLLRLLIPDYKEKFCEIYYVTCLIPIYLSLGHKGPFKWFDYLRQTKAIAAPVKLFDKVSTFSFINVSLTVP